MKFNKLLLALPVALTAMSPVVALSSCSKEITIEEVVKKFMANDAIKKVEVLKGQETFKFKVILYIEQQLDWKNKEAGVFTQRVELGLNSFDAINCVFIGGYDIYEEMYLKDPKNEFQMRYKSNYLNYEYRYFGKSVPNLQSGQTDTEYWQYLTSENAIEDIHHINQVLKTVLTGKWIITGGSKGGQTVDSIAMKYPDDANGFVSFVGPKAFLNKATSETSYDESEAMLNWILNKVGNESSLGATKAEENRFEVFKFMCYLLTDTVTTKISKDLYELCLANNFVFGEYGTQDPKRLYYNVVMDFPIGFWQMGFDIADIKGINDITDPTQKLEAAEDYFINNNSISDLNIMDSTYAYRVQAYKDMGIYNLNPQMIIDKAKQYNREKQANLPVPTFAGVEKKDYQSFSAKCTFTSDFLSKVTQDTNFKKQLDAWPASNKANVIMIYGKQDAWTAYKYDNIQNAKIHLFMNDNHHNSHISNLDDADKKKCWDLIDSWVK